MSVCGQRADTGSCDCTEHHSSLALRCVAQQLKEATQLAERSQTFRRQRFYHDITLTDRVEWLIKFVEHLQNNCPTTGGGCFHGDGNCHDFSGPLFEAYKAAQLAVKDLRGVTVCKPCEGRGFFVPTDQQESQNPTNKHVWCKACDGHGRALLGPREMTP